MNQPTTRRRKRIGWEQHFEYSGTVIAVTHDRYFLDNVAGWILELDRGKVFLGKVIILLG
jgi:ATPase subunit of ABC transporter with duplicated ATPase domains